MAATSIRLITTRIAAVSFAAGAVCAAAAFPLDPILLGFAMIAYAGLLWWRPQCWLAAVPALLPVLDLAPWTGWFFLDEIDLLLMVTAAVGYWRIGAEHRTARLPRSIVFLLIVLASAHAISTAMGLWPLTPLDANAFSSYLSHYNSLRVSKGFVWVVVLLPLVTRSAGADCINFRRYFVPGMLAGLAGVSLFDLWERMVFPGLSNFAADYRTTAPFSAMHTGGAALDGYLALALPFVFVWLLHERSWQKLVPAMGLFALGSYASLTTFSRGVYLAYGAMLLITMGLVLIRSRPQARTIEGASPRRAYLIVNPLLLILVFIALTQVFHTSGYRGFGAALILLACAVVAGGMGSLAQVAAALPVAVLLAVASLLLSGFSLGTGILKGPYLLFMLSVVQFAGGVFLALQENSPHRKIGHLVATAGLLWMVINAVMLAGHWGGDSALLPAGVTAAIALGLSLLNRATTQAFWRLGQTSLTVGFFVGVALAMAIPTFGSYYMSSRVSTAGSDFSYRLDHWQEALDMMEDDLPTSLFGMGLGTFPDTYFWKNTHGEVPATFRYEQEGTNHFLRLAPPIYKAGFGETIRILQRVALEPASTYRLSIDVRRSADQVNLDIAICERLLLYPQNCIYPKLKLLPADGKWHRYEVIMDSGRLGARPWLRQAPIQIALAVEGKKAVADIDNLSLVNRQTGKELIRNGTFSADNDGWFFSSDRHHLPWHVKNLFLNIYFEMGLFGLGALSLLVGVVMLRLGEKALTGDIQDGVAFASLAGFLLVGLFDSLLDVPRIAILFFLILLISRIRPVRRKMRQQNGRGSEPVTPAQGPAENSAPSAA